MAESSTDPVPAPPPPPRLTAGGLVAGGRYELLEAHGGVAGQAFWRAHDKRLRRDVALTFVDPLPGERPPGSATGVLDRTVALTGLYSDGLARVLDVIRGRAGGIVVSEWVPGSSLAAAAAQPDPVRAGAAVLGLSDAAAAAEASGLVLGLDSPDRIRLTTDGRALLAFPGVGAAADGRGDVRGLGAVLYTLLTGSWPLDLPEGSAEHPPVDGRPRPADRGDDGEVRDPAEVRPGVPADSAVLAMRSLDGRSVSSAATVRSMLTGLAGATDPAVSTAPAGFTDPAGPRPPVPAPAAAAPTTAAGATCVDPIDDHALQQRHWRIMAGTAAAAVVVISLLAAWLLGAFASGGDRQPLSQQLDAIERAAQQSREAAASSTAAPSSSAPSAPAPSTPVPVETAAAWQPASSQGTAENSATAPRVVDGERTTGWSTDTYYNQFGTDRDAFKSGIGLVLTLAEPSSPRRVVLTSPSDGVRFEIRAARSADPDSLEQTTLLGEGTVADGTATVTIDEPRETEYLVVWITRLASEGPQSFTATVTEVALSR